MWRVPVLEKIAELPVDAGCMIVGDPCYFMTADNTDHFKGTWYEFCDQVLRKMEVGPNKGTTTYQAEGSNMPAAAIVQTGYGDGSYPVYIERNKDGRVIKLIVDFDPSDEEDDG